MHKLLDTLKSDWRAIMTQAVIGALVVVALAWGLSALLHASAPTQRIDTTLSRAVQEFEAGFRAQNHLLCRIAEKQGVRHPGPLCP